MCRLLCDCVYEYDECQANAFKLYGAMSSDTHSYEGILLVLNWLVDYLDISNLDHIMFCLNNGFRNIQITGKKTKLWVL